MKSVSDRISTCLYLYKHMHTDTLVLCYSKQGEINSMKVVATIKKLRSRKSFGSGAQMYQNLNGAANSAANGIPIPKLFITC